VSLTHLADNFLNIRGSFRQMLKQLVCDRHADFRLAAHSDIGLIQRVDVGYVLHAADLSSMLKEQDDYMLHNCGCISESMPSTLKNNFPVYN
jgi:hypothetical protein